MIGWGAVWTGLKVIGLLFTIFYRPSFKSSSEKPNPNQLRIQTSEKGGVVPVVQGRRRVAGNLIWYDNFQTHEHYQEVERSSKGGGTETEQVFSHYSYTVSFAFGVCMGEVDILKIWQGKDEIPLDDWDSLGITVYRGTSDQTADSHIASFVDRSPAYRNLCYVVFENFNLGQMAFLPMFTFEVSSDISWEVGSPTNWGLSHPDTSAMCIDGNKLYLVQHTYYNDSDYICVYDKNTKELLGYREWEGAPYSYYLRGIDASNNEVYVSEQNHGKIYVFNSDLTILKRSWNLNWGTDIKRYKDEIYVVRWDQASGSLHEIYVTDIYGNFKRKWGIQGSGDGEYNCPFGIDAVNDEIYVSDRLNYRIQVTDTVGIFKRKWGSYGSGDGEFQNMKYLTIHEGKLLAVDYTNGIQIFSLAGVFESKFVANMGFSIAGSDNKIYYHQAGFVDDIRERNISYIEPTAPTIAENMLTNDLYGLGMSSSDLDTSSFADTKTYCEDNDLLISMLIDGKISMLDLLGNLTSYHNGYVVYENGKIAYKQIKSEDNVTIVNVATDVIKKDPPVEMTRESFRDVRNKVIVRYTKREDAYSTGIVVAEDEIHQQDNEIKETSLDLPAFCTGARAMKIAYTILRRAIEMPMGYSFPVGPKKAAELVPGAVFGLTDTQLGINEKPLRVISTSENDDGTIQIEAIEEIAFLLDDKSAPSDDYYIPLDRLGDPGDVRYPVVVELPPLVSGAKNIVVISFGSSVKASWFGAIVYDSFDDATYAQKKASVGECLMGKIDSVTDDNITVTITDSNESLNTKTDVFALLQDLNFNVCYDKEQNAFFRFAKATLISGAQWKLEEIIWDCYSIPILTHSALADDIISFMKYKQAPIDLEYDIARKGSTIYYKIPSYNYAGVAQSLSDISAENISFNAKGTAPIVPMNLEVDGLGSITKLSSGDIKIRWETCNRKDRGLDYERSDQITEDTDFVRFDIKVIDEDTDTVLRSVNVTATNWTYTSAMQTADGNKTHIKFEVEKVSETNRSETSNITINIL